MRVAVSGATGFVGRHIVTSLLSRGHQVVALSSSSAPYQTHYEQVRVDVVTGDGLAQAVRACDAIIHLVGIIREQRYSFAEVHVQGTVNMLQAAQEQGVKRFIHMSALGADMQAESRYYQSKARAESLVKASPLLWTIFRPSLIFGEGDEFFGKTLYDLVNKGPVIPQIGDGSFLFRPVWVGDVARAFTQALDYSPSKRQTYPLVGPDILSFKEMLLLLRQARGYEKKPLVSIPLRLMKLTLPLMQILPHPPISTDQFRMLLAGNSSEDMSAAQVFDLEQLSLKKFLQGP